MPTPPSSRSRAGSRDLLLLAGALAAGVVAAAVAKAQGRPSSRSGAGDEGTAGPARGAGRAGIGAGRDGVAAAGGADGDARLGPPPPGVVQVAGPGMNGAPTPDRPRLPTRTPLGRTRNPAPAEDVVPTLSVADIAPLAEAARASWTGGHPAVPASAEDGATATLEGTSAPVGDVRSTWGDAAGAPGPATDGADPATTPGPAAAGTPATNGTVATADPAARPAGLAGAAAGAAGAGDGGAGSATAAAGGTSAVRQPAGGRGATTRGGAGPGRGGLLVAALVAVVVAAIAVGLSAGGDDGDTRTAADPSTATTAAPGATTEPGTSGAPVAAAPPADPQEAFGSAAVRLETAGTFAYAGTVRALDVSPVRPTLWLGTEVAVNGEVELATARIHEVAVAGSATDAVETVVDGATVWGREADSTEALLSESFRPVPELSGEVPARKGMSLVPGWLTAVTGAVAGAPDAQGRATIVGELPGDSLGDEHGPVPDAQVTLTFGPTGDPAHVLLDAGEDLRIDVELARLGEPMGVTPPG